jgi:DNA modification methylase
MNFTNQIITGDCETILKECSDQTFKLIFTSPPYADTANKYKDGYKGVAPEDYCNWFIPKIKEFYRVLDNKGSFILNIDDKVIDGFRHPYVYELVHRITTETGFKLFERLQWNKGKSLCHPKRFRSSVEYLFWFAKEKEFTFHIDEFRVPYNEISIKRMKKPLKKRFARTEENQDAAEYKDWAPNPKGALPSTIINIGSESQRVADNHVAVFPLKLAEQFIKGATNEGDLVLDPFNGTGTTCLAAKKLRRNYCGVDRDSEYCKFAIQRIG